MTAVGAPDGASSPNTLLEARDVFAGYLRGVDILHGCSLDLRPGEIVGVIGPNGAGKSTLVKAMFGLVHVRAGEVRLNEADITNRAAHELVAAGVAYVPQLRNVFPSLTVEENLRMGSYLRPRDLQRHIDDIADLFPILAERRKERAGLLSGGQRQMVGMARALMTDPTVLLLDEPSAGLSPILQDEVFVRIHEINERGVAVVMVEQNARRCLQICDRAIVLDHGRNAHAGTGQELLDDPRVVELYLGTLAAR